LIVHVLVPQLTGCVNGTLATTRAFVLRTTFGLGAGVGAANGTAHDRLPGAPDAAADGVAAGVAGSGGAVRPAAEGEPSAWDAAPCNAAPGVDASGLEADGDAPVTAPEVGNARGRSKTAAMAAAIKTEIARHERALRKNMWVHGRMAGAGPERARW
jgi:hypothetical protein